MRIARWNNMGGIDGEIEFSIYLRKNGKYAVCEASAMAMNLFEILDQFSSFEKALGFFGFCIAQCARKKGA